MANGRNPGKKLDSGHPKTSTKHPIAAIEKRVIDSPAFADCKSSSIVVLLLLARNLEKGRNGHVFVANEDAARHGVEKKTFYKSLVELQTHGFIFPTAHGGHGKCSRYALTWVSLSKDTSGLHVENFKPCAWRDWVPVLVDKNPPRLARGKKKVRGKNVPQEGSKIPPAPQSGGVLSTQLVDKNPPVELIPISVSANSSSSEASERARRAKKSARGATYPPGKDRATNLTPATRTRCKKPGCEKVSGKTGYCPRHVHMHYQKKNAASKSP